MGHADQFARKVLGLGPEAGRSETAQRYRELSCSLRHSLTWLRHAGAALPPALVQETERHLHRVECAYELLTDGNRRPRRPAQEPLDAWIRWSVCPSCLGAVPLATGTSHGRLCSACRTSHVDW